FVSPTDHFSRIALNRYRHVTYRFHSDPVNTRHTTLSIKTARRLLGLSPSTMSGAGSSDAIKDKLPPLRERILATPTKFLPDQDPIAWLTHFDTVANSNHWYGASKLSAIGAYLGGSAQSWYQAKHPWKTYEEFSNAFKGRYHTHALKAQAGIKARNYQQSPNQSVEDVIVDLDRIFATASISDDFSKQTFLSAALRSDIRAVVLRGKPQNYEEMCNLAREEGQVLAATSAHDAYRQPFDQDDPIRAPRDSDIEEL
ncbi:hypothetical protein BGZ98_006146, partial [Dissophora globulifera]